MNSIIRGLEFRDVRRDAALVADELDTRLRTLTSRASGAMLGLSAYDYLTGLVFQFNADRWFHAASIIKVPVLVALFDAIDRGRFSLNGRLHVRNRFLSAADGMPFRIDLARDGDNEVHAARGRTMKLHELADRMIVRSSNLATNLLVDLLGVSTIVDALRRLDIDGVDLCRGVEDDRAFAHGLNNRMTPDGAVATLRCIMGSPVVSPEASTRMIQILLAQQFAGTIGPGLPEPVRAIARVAHKTGDISTVTHDAGIVFFPDRPPYVVAIFVESDGDPKSRVELALGASAAVYECVALTREQLQ
jgi:beta-lactamase class A